MEELKKHWTENGADDYLFRISADFMRFIEDAMDTEEINQAILADRLGVSEGRVSQVVNNPGNLTLRNVVQYARAVNRKVSLVGYDDGDRDNRNGPVQPEIFADCWERLGKPTDFFALPANADNRLVYYYSGRLLRLQVRAEPRADNLEKRNAATSSTFVIGALHG